MNNQDLDGLNLRGNFSTTVKRQPQTYEDLLAHTLVRGEIKGDRTGTGTRSIFGAQLRFDLAQGFPLITTKKVFLRGIFEDLMWFLRGQTDVRILQDKGVHIWDEWASTDGDIGPGYGFQWRSWPTPHGGQIDQIEQVMDQLRNTPDSRRMVVSAWNVADLDQMALVPCHALFQFYVSRGRLSCQLYQRSADLFLGVPFNIASYALLTHMVAQQLGLTPGEFIWVGGDTHIYRNHIDQVLTQLSRQPRPFPSLRLTKASDLYSYTWDDVEIVGYDPHPRITAPVAV